LLFTKRKKEEEMTNRKSFLISMAIILAIIVVKLLTPVKLKATIYGAISGQVVTEDTKKGLEDVTVYLCFPSMILITETKTDKNGRFSFDMVKERQYLLLFFPNPDSGYLSLSPKTGQGNKVHFDLP
jgi:hypothetical protein